MNEAMSGGIDITSKKALLKLVICIFVVYCLIFEFELIKTEITSALNMWINIIIPSVFPYLVIARYISDSDIMGDFEGKVGRLVSKILKISPCSIKAVVSSLICGYPSGAICTYALYDRGKISQKEAQKLICFTNNAGPLFLISAVGGGLMGSVKDGFVLYIIQIVSAFIYCMSTSSVTKSRSLSYSNKSKAPGDFCSAISASVISIVNICGFMTVAYVMSGCVMIALNKLCPEVCRFIYTRAIVRGFFEISSGVNSLSMLNNSNTNYALVCAFVSWSGISVILQIKSASQNIIKISKIMWAKFVQAIVSFGLGFAYKTIFTTKEIPIKGEVLLKYSLILCIGLFLFYILKRKRG